MTQSREKDVHQVVGGCMRVRVCVRERGVGLGFRGLSALAATAWLDKGWQNVRDRESHRVIEEEQLRDGALVANRSNDGRSEARGKRPEHRTGQCSIRRWVDEQDGANDVAR